MEHKYELSIQKRSERSFVEYDHISGTLISSTPAEEVAGKRLSNIVLHAPANDNGPYTLYLGGPEALNTNEVYLAGEVWPITTMPNNIVQDLRVTMYAMRPKTRRVSAGADATGRSTYKTIVPLQTNGAPFEDFMTATLDGTAPVAGTISAMSALLLKLFTESGLNILPDRDLSSQAVATAVRTAPVIVATATRQAVIVNEAETVPQVLTMTDEQLDLLEAQAAQTTTTETGTV